MRRGGIVFSLFLTLSFKVAACESINFDTSGVVREVTPTFDLVLEDGTTLALAGVRLNTTQASLPAFQGLRSLSVRYHSVQDASRDRWGRTFAFINIQWPEGGVFLQEQVIRAGWATVDRTGALPSPCQSLLQALEPPSTRFTAVRDPMALEAQVGRAIIVEGELVSVRVLDKQTYLNFGERWPESARLESLSVMIPRAVWDQIAPPLKAGDRVEIAGVIEKTRGYLMRVRDAKAIVRKDL
jgi:hypothetical protein